MSNRDNDVVVTVDLRVMVTLPKYGYSVGQVEQAISEALARKVPGAKESGRCMLHGVETFVEGEPANLPGGGIAIITSWDSFDPNGLTLAPK